MSRTKDVRKSDFNAKSAALTGDYFDFVRSGQNFRISFDNLLTSLGVSGALAPVGDVTAIATLLQSGGVNYIRGILGGSGILASLTVGGAIKIGHNFDINKTGAPIMANETADQPTLRSLVGGTGITVAASGDIIQISESGTPGSTKTVYVYEESDFPAAITGIITLADNTEYLLVNDVSTASRFILGVNTVVAGSDGSLITLTYTGALTMFTGIDKSVKFRDIALTCASGTLFDISSTTGAHIFRYVNGGVTCNNVGTFTHLNILYMYNVLFYEITTQGFLFSGDFNVALFDTLALIIPAGTGDGFNLQTATFDTFSINKILFTVDTTGNCLTGAAASANINAGGLGTVFNCQQNGSADFLNGNITSFDNLWEMHENSDVPNSIDLAFVTHAAATITIAASGTPVIVGATWVAEDVHRFTATAGGRFTYVGKGAHLSFTASISADITVGTDDITFFLYKNGVQIANSAVTREFTSGDIGNLSMLWEDLAETDDYYELWVQNDDTAVDVEIDKIILRIRS